MTPILTFKVGDKVLLSIASFSLVKTEPRWLGPYVISEKLSDLDYRLDLPDYLGIHNVFHVRSLKLAKASAHPQLPIPLLQPPRRIEFIISHRRGRGAFGPIFLTVKYVDSSLDLAEELPVQKARDLDPEIVDLYLAAMPTKTVNKRKSRKVTFDIP